MLNLYTISGRSILLFGVRSIISSEKMIIKTDQLICSMNLEKLRAADSAKSLTGLMGMEGTQEKVRRQSILNRTLTTASTIFSEKVTYLGKLTT